MEAKSWGHVSRSRPGDQNFDSPRDGQHFPKNTTDENIHANHTVTNLVYSRAFQWILPCNLKSKEIVGMKPKYFSWSTKYRKFLEISMKF
jgi:hypothetical protein